MNPCSTQSNLGEIYNPSSGTQSSAQCSNNRGNGRTCTHGACSKSRRDGQSTVGGKCRATGGLEPLQFSWGEDETGLEDQSREQAKQLGGDVQENPVERLNIGETMTTEVETGTALDAATVETEDFRAMITEENTEVVTIESSPEWGGTLIEEEHPEE